MAESCAPNWRVHTCQLRRKSADFSTPKIIFCRPLAERQTPQRALYNCLYEHVLPPLPERKKQDKLSVRNWFREHEHPFI
jgi:hypothetical protein